MASPTKYNPAAYDPAVIHWDWEKTKIINRPPGLPGPQQAPWDNKYFTRPEQPRTGTLKRSNAFIGDDTPQLTKNDNLKDDKPKVMRSNINKSKLNTKFNFPEALYSEAKLRTIEDMGNRFMRTIQKLDRGSLKEPINFNHILERHWAELAEFYSAQVSTVRELERNLKNVAPNPPDGLPPTPPPQIPPYLMTQLNDLKMKANVWLPVKKLRPFAFTKLEKESDFRAYSKPEERKPPAKDSRTPGLSNKVRETAHLNADEPYASESTEEIQIPAQKGHKNFPRKRVEVDVGPCITESPAAENINETRYCMHIGDKPPAQELEKEPTLKEAPSARPEPNKETESAIKPSAELGSRIFDKATTKDSLIQDIEQTEPDAVVEISQPNHNNTQNLLGYEKKNNQDIHTQQTDPRDVGIAYPMSSHFIESYYKTLAEVMRLATMNPGDTDEVHSDTDLNIPPIENRSDRVGKTKSSSGQPFHRLPLRLIIPPSQPIDKPGIFTPSEPKPETLTDEHTQHGFTEDTIDIDYENIYGPGSTEISSNTSKSSVKSENIIGSDDLSEVEFLADSPCDTISCTHEKITIDKAGDHPDMAVAKSPPNDSSNNSFSVSDDSYLFCGSTKHELEELQIEVKDHLDQAKKKGGLLVAKWVDEFSIRREKRLGTGDKARISKVTEDNEGVNSEDGEDGNEEENDDEGEGVEIYELEFADDGEGNEDDEEIDEEMEKILAWIALEDAKAEEDAKSKDKDFGLIVTSFNQPLAEKAPDATKKYYEGETGNQDIAATHLVAEKELSVVNEEDEDENENGDEKGESMKNEEECEAEEEKDVSSDEGNEEINQTNARTEGNDGDSERQSGNDKINAEEAKAKSKEENTEKVTKADEKPMEECKKDIIKADIEA